MNFTLFELWMAFAVVGILGALPPLFRRWSVSGLHHFVSVSAGIFLGTVFLHLLPELAGSGEHFHHHGGHARGGTPAQETGVGALAPWAAALAGLLLLFVIERVWLAGPKSKGSVDSHTVLWSATYLGLSLHALATGVALSAIFDGGELFLITILAHKGVETFSLATVMRLANLSRARSLALLGLFVFVTPVGLSLGAGVLGNAGLDKILTGFAAGTFLYVAVCDLLPEVFHGQEKSRTKLVSLLVGIGLAAMTLPGFEGALAFARDVATASAHVFMEMAPFLLIGFLLAGFISQLLKPEFFSKHLGRDDVRSVTLASVLGAPLPLCSCSVVPMAVSLRKAGASRGATAAFLVATPETGVDSVAVSWGLLGPQLAIARPISAIVSAILSGLGVNQYVKRRADQPLPAELEPGPEFAESTGSPGSMPEAGADVASCCAHETGPESTAPETTAPDTTRVAESAAPARSGSLFARVLRFAYVDLMDDLAVPLFIGLLISGVIAAAVPESLFTSPLAQGFTGHLLMLAIGIPVYVCATASTPIAATLILKGLSPGAAMVFLLASPATNLGSLYVLSRYLGRGVILVQVLTLAVVTLIIGSVVDAIFPLIGFDPSQVMAGGEHAMLPAWLSIGGASLMGLLMLASVLRKRMGRLVAA